MSSQTESFGESLVTEFTFELLLLERWKLQLENVQQLGEGKRFSRTSFKPNAFEVYGR